MSIPPSPDLSPIPQSNAQLITPTVNLLHPRRPSTPLLPLLHSRAPPPPRLISPSYTLHPVRLRVCRRGGSVKGGLESRKQGGLEAWHAGCEVFGPYCRAEVFGAAVHRASHTEPWGARSTERHRQHQQAEAAVPRTSVRKLGECTNDGRGLS